MNHVQIRKNRIRRIVLTALLFCAFGCILTGILALHTSNAARADAQNLSREAGASLFLPEKYEEYLKLEAPVDAAFSDKYIAIADGYTLYVYNRATQSYTKTNVDSDRTISKIGFTSDGKLFVSDTGAGNYFYKYSFEGNSLEQISSINCSTFCISGDKLYTATISGSASISEYSIPEIESGSPKPRNLGTLSLNTTPSMTVLNQKLYCTFDDRAYCVDLTNSETFDEHTGSYLSLKPSDATHVKSTCAHNDAFYYTASDGLYRAEFSATDNSAGQATCVLVGKDFGALTSFEGSLYCLRGKSVLRFDPDPASEGADIRYQISDYEITSASSSVGRLSGATDIVRAGSLVVIADTANHRVTVYNSETNAYSVLAPEEDETFSPAFVATDGTMVAAATTEKVYVCNDPMKDPKFAEPVSAQNGTIKGIACVYGSVYYVTQNNYQGMINGEGASKSNGGTPAAMTSDLYGNLYVAYSDTTVRSFTEEQFIAQSADGTTVEGVTIPSDAKSLRADFEGGLYYLDNTGKFCGKDGAIATVDGASFVYLGEGNVSPTAFALGYEDDEVYFLFGDYIVKSKKGTLGLPSFGRLSNAKDIARAGTLLITADTDNNRVTVYDTQKRSFSVIQTNFSPSLVATDGSVIAAACGNKVYVCDYGDECFGEPTTADIGTIKGLACVHGNVYYITEYGYGKVEEIDKGLVSRFEDSLVALAADSNGILYVVDSDGHVQYFYEDEFIDTSIISGGDMELSLHMPISSLRADSEGNLYYLSENALWKNEEKLTELETSSVGYGGENSPVAFALDFESDNVYLLYDDYIVKAKQETLGIPPRNQSSSFGNRQDILLPDSRRKRG